MKYFTSLVILILLISSCQQEDQNDAMQNQFANGFRINASNSASNVDLDTLTQINGHVIILHTDLTNFSFLSSIERINGKLELFGNNSIENLNDLRNLRYVKSLIIHTNENLSNIDFIENLEIKEELIIWNNNISDIPIMNRTDSLVNLTLNEENLNNINCLTNLKQVSNELTIVNLLKIENLEPLNSLTNIGLELNIENNSMLNDFCGIKLSLLNSNPFTLNINYNLVNPTKEDILQNCN